MKTTQASNVTISAVNNGLILQTSSDVPPAPGLTSYDKYVFTDMDELLKFLTERFVVGDEPKTCPTCLGVHKSNEPCINGRKLKIDFDELLGD